MMHRLFAYIPLVIIIVVAGCGGTGASEERPSNALSFTVPKRPYVPADSATLRLKNETDHPVAYNLCVAALERDTDQGARTADAWDADRDNDGVAEGCRLILRRLAPGETATRRVLLPRDLKPGTYWFKTEVKRAGGREEAVRTNLFAVIE